MVIGKVLSFIAGIFTIFTIANAMQCPTTECDTFESLKSTIIAHVTEGSLVIFDVDLVLVQDDPIKTFIRKQLCTYATLKLCTREAYLKATTKLELDYPPTITNETFPEFIASLKERGATVICLTDTLVGPMGEIESFPALRIERLQGLMLNFSDAFPQQGEASGTKITFAPDIKSRRIKLNEQCALFQAGILFSNGYRKSYVLESFLKRLKATDGYAPANVIFIDDRPQNTRDVSKTPMLPSDSCCIEYNEHRVNEAKIQSQNLKQLKSDARRVAMSILQEVEQSDAVSDQ